MLRISLLLTPFQIILNLNPDLEDAINFSVEVIPEISSFIVEVAESNKDLLGLIFRFNTTTR